MGWVGVLWVLELGLGCNIVLMSNENLNQENLCGYVNQYIFSGCAKEEAIQELRIKYNKDPALLTDVIHALQKNMESSLDLHKRRLLGSLPKSRDEFDPWSLLMKLDVGNMITVLDSNKDISVNWKEFDMKKFLGDGLLKVLLTY